MSLCIGVDCDEVLSETINELLKISPLKERGIKKSDIFSYDLYEIEELGMTMETVNKLFYSFFDSKEYSLTQPVSGAYEKLYERKECGHKLFVVTGRPKPYEQITRQWVESHFPGIFGGYLFMNQHTENEIPKSVLCRQNGIELLIDDTAQNIIDMNSIGMPGFLLDKPRNQGIKDSELLHRVYSRDDIDLSQISKLTKKFI